MQLSFAQLEGLWVQAGGPAAVAPIAAAIALAESSGNTNAFNPNDTNGMGGTQVSAGLWQISTGTMSPFSTQWNDPLTNAEAAVAKYNGAGGFSPWGTFNTGKYLQFLNQAQATAISNGTFGGGSASVTGQLPGLPAIGATAQGVTSTISSGASSAASSTAAVFSPTPLAANTQSMIIAIVAIMLIIGAWALLAGAGSSKSPTSEALEAAA